MMYLQTNTRISALTGTQQAAQKVRNMKGKHMGICTRALSALLLVIALPVHAQSQRELVDVQIGPGNAANSISIELKLNQAAPEPSVFALETPPRISVDIPATSVALEKRRMAVNVAPIQSVTAVEASGRSRVVVNLESLGPYKVSAQGKSIFIVLQADESASAPVASQPVIATSSPASSTASGVVVTRAKASNITQVDFRRSETGAGQLIVDMNNAASNIDVRNEGGKIVVVFRNSLPIDSMINRMDVLDFATPVKFVDVAKDGSDGRISVTPVSGAQFDQVSYQVGNTFTLELQPLTKQEQDERARAEPQYTGERLNVNFQNIEIRSLLQIIADVAGKNMVTSDSVGGSITLRLNEVPWDQALEIILKTKGLAQEQNGNVIRVAPIAELKEQQKLQLETNKQAKELAPLVSEILQINYAKAADLMALLMAENSSFKSDRGSIATDDRTNVLIVNDTREKLADIQRLVRRLDIPVRQVLIESRVVVANDDFSRSIGSRIGVGVADVGNSVTIAGSGNIGAATELQNIVSGTSFQVVDNNRLSTAFNAAGVGGASPASYALSILGSDYLVDLELSALQAEGKGEVVSTPRVITADGREALIEQGEEIPYISTASGGSGGAQTQFKKAVLALRVTPQITPDNKVILDLEVSKDARGDLAAGGQPAINTSSVNTQVLVSNGETVVLGGIFEQNTAESVNKVPLLGDIPILGYLFRTKSKINNKRELLIFVTPKILSNGVRSN